MRRDEKDDGSIIFPLVVSENTINTSKNKSRYVCPEGAYQL